MNITAKQIERSNAVIAFTEGSAPFPEPSQIFALYAPEQARGSLYSDNAAMATRVFELPNAGLQLVFEPGRTRVEDKQHRTPTDSKVAAELVRIMGSLAPKASPIAYGFNYDIIYRVDNVIPMRDIMAAFVKTDAVEDVKTFGWQYTISKEKGKKLRTYFFKAVSPIELSVHANFNFTADALPDAAALQAELEKCYIAADEAVAHLSF